MDYSFSRLVKTRTATPCHPPLKSFGHLPSLRRLRCRKRHIKGLNPKEGLVICIPLVLFLQGLLFSFPKTIMEAPGTECGHAPLPLYSGQWDSEKWLTDLQRPGVGKGKL